MQHYTYYPAVRFRPLRRMQYGGVGKANILEFRTC